MPHPVGAATGETLGAARSDRQLDLGPRTTMSRDDLPRGPWRTCMPDTPTLYVCHGDDGGPRVHPCRRVQEAMREKGIDYEKVIAAHGNPIPFLRKGSREELERATGSKKLPALKLANGTVLTNSKEILRWVSEQRPPGSTEL